MLEYIVKSDDRSLAEHYTRCSGTITAPDGTEYLYEYGQYPQPADDGEGDELVFGVRVMAGGNFVDDDKAISLLRDAGVWSGAHVEWLRKRFAGYPGADSLHPAW